MLQAAGASFDAIDANKEGKLVVGEIPPEPRGGPAGHGKNGFRHDRPPQPDAETDGNAVALTPAPAK